MRRIIAFVLILAVLLAAVPASALTYDELLQKAEEYSVNGDYEKAFACYDLAVKNEPDNPLAYIRAGFLYLEQGNDRMAGESVEKALAIDATLEDGWLLKCCIDIMTGDAAAFDADALYAEICGADLSAYSTDIGCMYAKAGFYDKAVTAFSAVTVDSLNDEQKSLYRRALMTSGEKEKAVALGLTAETARNENLDAAFDSGYPTLVETAASTLKAAVSDFEITDDMKALLEDKWSMDDMEGSLSSALEEAELHPFSRSPSGNSGLISAGKSAFAEYNGKYHIIYPSAKRGVEDTYLNLQMYYDFFNSRIRNLLGEEGVSYSPDGRYAALFSVKSVLLTMYFFMDPILLDLSTGELILTSTTPTKFSEENASAVTTTMFSSDGRFFYYLVYGRFGEARARLYRYDLGTGETELCIETEELLYYPRIAELEDGSLLMVSDAMRNGETQSMVVASCHDGEWSMDQYPLKLVNSYCYTNRLLYSDNSGIACLLEKLKSGVTAYTSFQIVRQEDGFAGLDRFMCVSKADNRIVVFSPEEYKAAIDDELQGREGEAILSPKFPYQSIQHAVFSPDGNYLLMTTYCKTLDGESRRLLLVRLEDMEVREVQGLDPADLQVGASAVDYTIGIEWNTDELIIGTNDGVRTYTFAAGSPEASAAGN